MPAGAATRTKSIRRRRSISRNTSPASTVLPAPTSSAIKRLTRGRRRAFRSGSILVADDVGAGKTVEAGLVLREMLLRRRIDFVLVAAPAGMVRQWQEELDAKFGLSFTIVDRDYLAS